MATPVRPSASAALGVAIGALGVSNVVTNLWLPAALYVPWNLGIAGGLVTLTRWSGHEPADLGLDRSALGRGVRAGTLGAAIVGAGYGVALLSRTDLDIFRDERATSLTSRAARWHVLARIPLGTALAEEVMFRGVLPALLARSRPPWLPGALSSLLFGLWHVLPSLELARTNVAVGRFVGASAARAAGLSVALATAAGVVLHALRARTGHLAAPTLVHCAANAVGLVAARVAARRHEIEPTALRA